jgi:hypothetical protein
MLGGYHKYVSIKSPQVDLQKGITWLKKYGKNRQKWNKVNVEIEIQPQKIKHSNENKVNF